MTSERWLQIRALLDGALQLEPGERPAYVEHHCSGDPSLRKDLDSFLAVEQELRSSFLESPVTAQVGPDASTGSLAALTVGAKLGPYEIQALLGAGGMGQVYLARDTRLGRFVAIKFLPEDRGLAQTLAF